MKNSIQVSISNPCSEDFSKFKKTAKGGFCNVCSKDVIDFTGMTSPEIVTHFKNNSSKTCGQFRKEQLKTYTEPITSQKRNYFNWVGGFGMTLITLSLIHI